MRFYQTATTTLVGLLIAVAAPAARGQGATNDAFTLSATSLNMLKRDGDHLMQPLRLVITSKGSKAVEATVRIEGVAPVTARLKRGSNTVDVELPAVDAERTVKIELDSGGSTVARAEATVKPVRKMTLYVLPHSHVDIGYTHIQTEVERMQVENLDKAIALAKATANNPEGSRFKWNTEVLWEVDSYLRAASPEKQREFIDAVKQGMVGLDAMYGNELTGLCRPEELVRLFRFGTELTQRFGVKIQSAMISDVPGYTWGMVPAMAQAGIKYWSIGPNQRDRIGFTLHQWENKPFWWVGPNGQDRVLCWMACNGYSWSHRLRRTPTPTTMGDLMLKMQQAEYPYDLAYVRWCGHGDNGPPDPQIVDFAKEWNEQYVSPHVTIGTVAEVFSELERRYGDQLPTYRGDWTPYWEDGAGSSALETGLNRNSADRLVQAEALWAMLRPTEFPAADFYAAWRNVLLYSEHTWGANTSIREPDGEFTRNQWKIKQAFALDADRQSRELLGDAFKGYAAYGGAGTFDVYNTTSWPRADLVLLPPEATTMGDRVVDEQGRQLYSQRLLDGELAFLPSTPIAPFSVRRFTVQKGEPIRPSRKAVVRGTTLQNGLLTVRYDEQTGNIVELRAAGIDANLVDTQSIALNDFFYITGTDAAHAQRPTNVRFSLVNPGPLVAAVRIEADAPGCNMLSREIRLAVDQDYVEIINTIDKRRIENASRAKEGLHFGYAFNVPGGEMRMDIPWAMIRPEADQLPGACKNWISVGRWVDISNQQYGVTWATLDAPLVEVGGLTANLLGVVENLDDWIAHLQPSQTIYSWVMNNHWHTNYRAYQEGPTVFRYAIRPHQAFSSDDATRFAVGLSQPLVRTAAMNAVPGSRPTVEGTGVVVTAFKPSDDGQANIVRLFGCTDQLAQVKLRWSEPQPGKLWLSDTSERPLKELGDTIDVPAWGIVTVRAERK